MAAAQAAFVDALVFGRGADIEYSGIGLAETGQDVGLVGDPARVGAGLVADGPWRGEALLDRPAFLDPGLEAAVEQRQSFVPQGVERPEQAAGLGVGLVVVGDDLRLGQDAKSADDLLELAGLRQQAHDRWPAGHDPADLEVTCTGYVALFVAGGGRQVDDDEAGVAEVVLQGLAVDERWQ